MQSGLKFYFLLCACLQILLFTLCEEIIHVQNFSTLNFANINSKFRVVAMFVIVHFQKIFKLIFCVCLRYLSVPNSIRLCQVVYFALRFIPKAKEDCPTVSMFYFKL
jgi:hypothetical protein